MTITLKPAILPSLSIGLEADGPEADPHIWLRGSFDMWGAMFHIECYRVKVVNDGTSTYQQLDVRTRKDAEHSRPVQIADYNDWQKDFERLETAHAPDGGFQTVDIDGADYAVFIYPASDS